jgi:hypothetical protein
MSAPMQYVRPSIETPCAWANPISVHGAGAGEPENATVQSPPPASRAPAA